MLNEQQKAQFWKDGYLLVENVVSQENLHAMKEDFAAWVEESRAHTGPYGEAIDGRARFDVEPGHTADKPGLRRVNAPIEVSAAYFEAMADSGMTDVVADLIEREISSFENQRQVARWYHGGQVASGFSVHAAFQ